MLMGIIGWAVVGAVVGFAASKLVDLRGDDPGLGIGLAIFAAIVGAVLYTVISGSGVSSFNIWSLLCAAAASIGAVAIWHVIRGRSPSVTPTTRRSY